MEHFWRPVGYTVHMETDKQLAVALRDSVGFMLSTTFQVNMDMLNGHQIKVRFLPYEARTYRFRKKDMLKHFGDAMMPVAGYGVSIPEVCKVAADHLNDEMIRIETDIVDIIIGCGSLMRAIRRKEPGVALVTIQLILDALKPYEEVSVASKMSETLAGAICVISRIE